MLVFKYLSCSTSGLLRGSLTEEVGNGGMILNDDRFRQEQKTLSFTEYTKEAFYTRLDLSTGATTWTTSRT